MPNTQKIFNKSAIGTTAVQLTSTSNPAQTGVEVIASPSNSGTVWVGVSSSVTSGTADSTDGIPLAAGTSAFLYVSDANMIYAIGSAAGQRVAVHVL